MSVDSESNEDCQDGERNENEGEPAAEHGNPVPGRGVPDHSGVPKVSVSDDKHYVAEHFLPVHWVAPSPEVFGWVEVRLESLRRPTRQQ